MSGRVYGLDEGALQRFARYWQLMLRQNLVPGPLLEDVRELLDEAAGVKAEGARRTARMNRDANSDANSGRSVTQTVSPSGASASGVESVESLARRATVTPAAVTRFLRRWEVQTGCRLPRDGRRWGLIPAGVSDEFLAQSRKVRQ